MANSLVWADLKAEQLQSLRRAGPRFMHVLSVATQLNDYESDLKQRIQLEAYFHLLHWAENQGLTLDKTSALFSIVKQLLQRVISSPLYRMQDDFDAFQDTLLMHSVQRPPWSVDVFSLEEVQLITDHVTDTVFRSYALYKYAFTARQKLSITPHYVELETAPIAPPLAMGEMQVKPESVTPSETPEAVAAAATAVTDHTTTVAAGGGDDAGTGDASAAVADANDAAPSDAAAEASGIIGTAPEEGVAETDDGVGAADTATPTSSSAAAALDLSDAVRSGEALQHAPGAGAGSARSVGTANGGAFTTRYLATGTTGDPAVDQAVATIVAAQVAQLQASLTEKLQMHEEELTERLAKVEKKFGIKPSKKDKAGTTSA